MSDGSGATAWSYDKMGRVLNRQQTISTVTKSIGYSYNLDGSVATMTYPSGRVYTYTYNNAEQIASLVDTAHSLSFVGRVAGDGFAGFRPEGIFQATGPPLPHSTSLANLFLSSSAFTPCSRNFLRLSASCLFARRAFFSSRSSGQ